MSSKPDQPQPGFFRWTWQQVDGWLFGHGSPLTLGAVRAVMGGLILISLVMLIPSYHDWFSENGYISTELDARYFEPTTEFYGSEIPRVNLFGLASGPLASLFIFSGTLLAALFTTIGLWTRVATIVLAIGMVSLHHRNGFILHGGDTLSRVFVLYLAIAPCGAAFSIDRLRALKAGRPDPALIDVSLWPQRLMQLQVAIIYFTSTWHKWTGHHWRDGSAVWYPMNLNEFDRFPVPEFAISTPMIMAATYGTLIVQLGVSTLAFYRPLRTPILIAAAGLHLSIEYAMNIPLFSYLMIATYLSFYDGDEIRRAWNRIAGKLRFRGVVAREAK